MQQTNYSSSSRNHSVMLVLLLPFLLKKMELWDERIARYKELSNTPAPEEKPYDNKYKALDDLVCYFLSLL